MDRGMEERRQEMSLEKGQQECETKDRQRGQLILRPEAEWSRARVRAGRAAP